MQRLTIERTALIVLFLLLFALATRIPVDTDMWWHLRSGEHTLTEGIIRTDPFSHTRAGEPWINHSWGAQVILFGAWQLAGNFGLAVLTSALATGGMAVIYRMCAGSVYLRAFVLVLGSATAAVFWSPRPQMFSFFLSTVVLYILWLWRTRETDRLWFLVPVMWLWGNLHAGFSIGFIFMAGVIGGEVLNLLFTWESKVGWKGVQKLIAVSIVSAAAITMNPYTYQMLLVPFQTVGIDALTAFIQEWQSPDFQQRQTWPFIALLLGILGAAGASNKRVGWTDFALVSGTAFMALLAGRNIAVFAVAATPVLSDHLDAILTERGWVLRPVKRVTPFMARLNAGLVAVIALACLAKVLVVLDTETVNMAQATRLPIAATEFLIEENPPGALFNSYNWGGYLVWAAPQHPVFVDGRTDLYGDEIVTTYLETALARDGWQNTLDEYDIGTVFVEAGSGLARELSDDDAWALEYEDELAVIFVREGA